MLATPWRSAPGAAAVERAHIGRSVLMMLQDVAGEAAEALGRLAPGGAVELLLELSEDRAPEVRTVAVRALGEIEETAAVARAVQALAADSGVPSTVAATALLQQGQVAGEPRAARAAALGCRHPPPRRSRRRAAAGAGCRRRAGGLLGDDHESVRLASA